LNSNDPQSRSKNHLQLDNHLLATLEKDTLERPQRVRAYKLFLILSMSIFFPFSFLNAFVFNMETLAWFELASGLICLILFFVPQKSRYDLGISYLLVILAGFLLCGIVLSPETQPSIVIWIGLFPVIAYYLLGLKAGTISYSLFSVGLFIGFYYKFAHVYQTVPLNDLSNIGGGLIAYGLFIFLYEYSRNEALTYLFSYSIHDELTQIGNRKFFTVMLQKEKAQAKRSQQPLALILIDIDHFKTINDTHGHMAGDAVLRAFASLLQKHIREGDTLARWGGEEFAIILPQNNTDQAAIIAEKLKTIIEKHAFSDVRNLTASFGVAEVFPEESDDATMRRVDSALYRAKANGRNRVETA
jgi:diguanylate cyclase (GGDEF)-like protein